MSGKILRFNVESFGGAKNMEVEWPEDKAIMVIFADGGLGKTSLKEFVRACLDGLIPEELINTELGKSKGWLEFVLDGTKNRVEIAATKKSETVRVKNDRNMSGGKEVLRSLVGPVSINPFQFKKMKPEEQLDFYSTFFNFDTKAFDSEIDVIYKKRTEINRKVTELKGVVAASPFSKMDAVELATKYKEEKVIEELNKKLTDAIEENKKKTLKEGEVNAINSKIENAEKSIFTLGQEIKEIEDQLRKKRLELIKVEEDKDIVVKNKATLVDELELMEEKDTTFLQQEIQQANTFNNERLQFIDYLGKVSELDNEKKASNRKSLELEQKEREKELFVREKKPDIAGLELITPKPANEDKPAETRNGMYWFDKPVNVLSTTEAITLSINLRRYKNPNGLPILLLDDFESVGSQGIAEVAKLCREENYQALCCYMDPKQTDLKIVFKNDFDNINER